MADPVPPPANDGAPTNPPGLPLFYKNVVPVDPNQIPAYGMTKVRGYRFAAETHAVPLSISEFVLAEKHYPIVFGPGDPPMPVTALGLTRNENLYVQGDGTWAEDHYVPGYIRRYPFILAEFPKEKDRLFLCVDTACEYVTDQNPEAKFFEGKEATEGVKQMLEFCRRFQEDMNTTRNLCAELNRHGLLKETELQYRAPDGQSHVAGRFISIDSKELEKLSDATILDFHKRGILSLIMFQQSSQSNWGRLAQRKERQLAAAAVLRPN